MPLARIIRQPAYEVLKPDGKRRAEARLWFACGNAGLRLPFPCLAAAQQGEPDVAVHVEFLAAIVES